MKLSNTEETVVTLIRRTSTYRTFSYQVSAVDIAKKIETH